MDTFISKSPEETRAHGARCAAMAVAGSVYAISGDLGAGKTQWVKGFAAGLEFEGRVSSPTFSLVNEYFGGRLPLFHLDLYRLETAQQVLGAGLQEFLPATDGVTVVEWPERWYENGGSQPGVIRVSIEALDENSRKITYEDIGH